MICVIEREQKCVWGFGPTPAIAMNFAQCSVAGWRSVRQSRGLPAQVGELEYARLSDDADLTQGGAELWDWVVFDDSVNPEQEELF